VSIDREQMRDYTLIDLTGQRWRDHVRDVQATLVDISQKLHDERGHAGYLEECRELDCWIGYHTAARRYSYESD
jgi:hypothetical protein